MTRYDFIAVYILANRKHGTLYAGVTLDAQRLGAQLGQLQQQAFGEYATWGPRRTALGRNDPCPCGSGIRFKRCCLKSGRF